MYPKLQFDNFLHKALPIEDKRNNPAAREVPNACFSPVTPTPLPSPSLIAWSPTALQLLGVASPANDAEQQALCSVGCGADVPLGSKPLAHVYAGYQFGNFAGQLGDGAVVLLGEVVVPPATLQLNSPLSGKQASPWARWELQLKGSGQTPFSREGTDGRKTFRSSLREFLASEAMYGLGIPTTRAATITVSRSLTVERDRFHNDHVTSEPCAIITRVAESFLRFGSFEIACGCDEKTLRAGPSAGNVDVLKQLFDYAAVNFFSEQVRGVGAKPTVPPEMQEERGPSVVRFGAGANRVAAPPKPPPKLVLRFTESERPGVVKAVFRAILKRTAKLIAHWQSVGFCHGVLNTDNMSILGLTLDYGPFAFVEYFDEDFIHNVSDENGRYSFHQQPCAAKWNLLKLADAFGLMHPEVQCELRGIVEGEWETVFEDELDYLVAGRKLGLLSLARRRSSKQPAESNFDSIKKELRRWRKDFFDVLQKTGADMTKAFQLMTYIQPGSASKDDFVEVAKELANICVPIDTAIQAAQTTSKHLMRHGKGLNRTQLNGLKELQVQAPDILKQVFHDVPSHLIQQHLEEEDERLRRGEAVKAKLAQLQTLTAEEKKQRDFDAWFVFVERYGQEIERMDNATALERLETMRMSNPVFVLRPWILEHVTKAALKEPAPSMSVQRLVERLMNPFDFAQTEEQKNENAVIVDKKSEVFFSYDEPDKSFDVEAFVFLQESCSS